MQYELIWVIQSSKCRRSVASYGSLFLKKNSLWTSVIVWHLLNHYILHFLYLQDALWKLPWAWFWFAAFFHSLLIVLAYIIFLSWLLRVFTSEKALEIGLLVFFFSDSIWFGDDGDVSGGEHLGKIELNYIKWHINRAPLWRKWFIYYEQQIVNAKNSQWQW